MIYNFELDFIKDMFLCTSTAFCYALNHLDWVQQCRFKQKHVNLNT